MNIIETYDYRLPEYALCALVNGDISGIDDNDDIKAIELFEVRLLKLVERHKGVYFVIDYGIGEIEPYFSNTNCFNNMGGNVIDIQVNIMGLKK